MSAPMDMRQRAALSDYLAAERTFLAWIRTGLALMGFGFVVTCFGLFLQELQVARHMPRYRRERLNSRHRSSHAVMASGETTAA